MPLVIVLCWNRSPLLAVAFIFFFGSIEALYFSAALVKFIEGAWVPLALSLVFLAIMLIWHYGTLKQYEFEVQNKVSLKWLLSLGPELGIVRVRGIGLVHTELVSGIPAILSHFITNLPAFHQVLLLFCVKCVPVPHVRPEERFLIGRIGPKEYRVYRCIARYGYHDIIPDDVAFEEDLVSSMAEFIRSEGTEHDGSLESVGNVEKMIVIGTPSTHSKSTNEDLSHFFVSEIEKHVETEMDELMEAREAGMAFILGHCYVKAKMGSSLIKRIAIDVGYDFLRRNSRAPTYASSFPRASTLEVGMLYYV